MPSKEPLNISLRPASPDEACLFYALPPEKDEELKVNAELCSGAARQEMG